LKPKKERSAAQIASFQKVLEANKAKREQHKEIKTEEHNEKEVKKLKRLEDEGLIEIKVKPKKPHKDSENHPFNVVKRQASKKQEPIPAATPVRVVSVSVPVVKPPKMISIYDNLFTKK
jgi:hypothetical protein